MPARLIALFLDLLSLRRGPQDLPHAPVLVVAVVVAVLLVESWSSRALGVTTSLGPPLVLSGLLALAIPWTVLRLRALQPRFWQTALALAGTGLVFALLALPLMLAMGPVDPANAANIPPLLGWSIVLLAGWRLIVAGHIWRHALEVPLPSGVLVALATFIAELVLQRLLLGLLAGPAT
ncbi:MAG: hypothetical protein U0S76_06205 [Pseudoxanthomonas sp.]|nr:hypothetical protein [Pseudoxanthomonas sp.]